MKFVLSLCSYLFHMQGLKFNSSMFCFLFFKKIEFFWQKQMWFCCRVFATFLHIFIMLYICKAKFIPDPYVSTFLLHHFTIFWTCWYELPKKKGFTSQKKTSFWKVTKNDFFFIVKHLSKKLGWSLTLQFLKTIAKTPLLNSVNG